MSKVMNLTPGDVVRNGGETWVFVGAFVPHPLYPSLWGVVWVSHNGRLSMDALHPQQDVGEVVRTGEDLRVLAFGQEWVVEKGGRRERQADRPRD